MPLCDLKHFEAIEIDSVPDIRITPIAPVPEGEAKATIVFSDNIM